MKYWPWIILFFGIAIIVGVAILTINKVETEKLSPSSISHVEEMPVWFVLLVMLVVSIAIGTVWLMIKRECDNNDESDEEEDE